MVSRGARPHRADRIFSPVLTALHGAFFFALTFGLPARFTQTRKIHAFFTHSILDKETKQIKLLE